ncbi:MAG: prepilin-type N-terminal cleavage/methylation domain-containing protein [Desulfurivibrionaceae bacterium]
MTGATGMALAAPATPRLCGTLRCQAGITLFELLIAVVLLGMVSTMIYSVLNVGINFSVKGGEHLNRLARERNLLGLLQRQVNEASYDLRSGKVDISGEEGLLRIVTRQPLLHRTAGVVLAVYRVNPDEQALYYLEKKDYFNVEYGEKFLPDFSEMRKMYAGDRPVALAYDSGKGSVTVGLGEEEFVFFPKCLPPGVTPSFSVAEDE